MNITNTLIRLRDDLKRWVSNNMLELEAKIPTIDGLATEEFVMSEIGKLKSSLKVLENLTEIPLNNESSEIDSIPETK